MNYGIKKMLVRMFIVTTGLSFTNMASASLLSSDAENLAKCRGLMNHQVGEVDRTKVANIKSKARSFTVTFKVVDGGERSLVQCKLTNDELASVSCLKGNACKTETVALEEK